MSTDKPRADLVALFDAVAALPASAAGRGVDLYLKGDDVGAELRAWATLGGRLVEEQPLYNASLGAWTFLEVKLAGGRIGVHLDIVQFKQPPAANSCSRCGDLMMTTSTGERCISGCVTEQPQAAEGSV